MQSFDILYRRLIEAFDDDSVKIPCCGLKFIRHDEEEPLDTFATSPKWLDEYPRSLASCGFSYKAAKGGWTLRVTVDNIGCPAGAVSLGLCPADATCSFQGGCYVKPMKKAAVPKDFLAGHVYAPHQSGHPEFSLFGEEDSGRYETVEAAERAVSGMVAIPPVMKAVYYYHPRLSRVDVDPDLVHVYCTPLQAMRMVQGYCYSSGERFTMSCIGIRGVSCDMTALPYMTGEINGTFLCLGARAISRWEEEYVGFGIPYEKLAQVVEGMEKSRTGFPYEYFPKMPRGVAK